MEPVARICRGLVAPWVAHHVDHEHAARGLRVDDLSCDADRQHLLCAALLDRRVGVPRHAGHVRQIHHDQARTRRPFADRADERREILSERLNLAVDVADLIRSARPASQRGHDRVDVVGAREDRDERGRGRYKRRLLVEEISGNRAAVLRAEILDAAAEYHRGDSQIGESHRKTSRSQLAGRHLDVASSLWAVDKRYAGRGRSEANRIARANGYVGNGGARLRNRPGSGGTISALLLAGRGNQYRKHQPDRNAPCAHPLCDCSTFGFGIFYPTDGITKPSAPICRNLFV